MAASMAHKRGATSQGRGVNELRIITVPVPCCCRRAANAGLREESCILLECEPAELQQTLLAQVMYMCVCGGGGVFYQWSFSLVNGTFHNALGASLCSFAAPLVSAVAACWSENLHSLREHCWHRSTVLAQGWKGRQNCACICCHCAVSPYAPVDGGGGHSSSACSALDI